MVFQDAVILFMERRKNARITYVFEKGNPEIVRHLAFRDYMMAHCEEAEAYATLKALAEKYTYDGALYSEGKLSLYVMLMKKRRNGWKIMLMDEFALF